MSRGFAHTLACSRSTPHPSEHVESRERRDGMQLARWLGMRSAYLGALALTLVTSILATVGCSSATEAGDDDPSMDEGQLIGRTAAGQRYAAVGALADETNDTFCTATLVTKNVIVTAMYRKFKPLFFCPELYRRTREPSRTFPKARNGSTR